MTETTAAAATTAVMECKLKKKCPNTTADIHNCWNPDCQGWMHVGCSSLLLNRHCIPVEERPTGTDRTDSDEPVVFCTKGCYSKWKSHKKKKERAAVIAEKASKVKKRKVPWEEDGSMDILMEWLTTEGNYSNYCGGAGSKGTSKAQFQKHISLLIKEKNPESEGRNDKDVENKITSLERQFRLASDWANNTGQGVDQPGDFEAAILKRCPHYKQLEDIMGDRPNAKPLYSNEPEFGLDDDDNSVVSGEVYAAAVNEINNPSGTTDGTTDETPTSKAQSVSTLSTNKSTSSGAKRITTGSLKGTKKQKPSGADAALVEFLESSDFESLREREVVAREKEANARMIEAVAMQQKAKKETSILDIEEKVKLLQARKKLMDDGACTADELDLLLPLPGKEKGNTGD